MKFGREFSTLLALLCVCLIYQIDGVPQIGFRRPQQHHNATAWNNNWRQNATQLRPNWQTISNRNYSNPNWQSQGERLWLNNNQSHPHIQVPGFRSSPHYVAAKQTNRSIPVRTGWQQAQPMGPYLTNWAPIRNNLTQNIPSRTQPFKNGGGVQYAPTNSGWLAPGNPTANYTHGKGGVSNNTINGNRGFATQANNGANLYPNWHAGLPGSALVAGTYNGNLLPVSTSGQQGWQTANQGGTATVSNLGPQLAPLAGSISGHQNAPNTGWNVPNGQPNGAYSAHPYGKLFA